MRISDWSSDVCSSDLIADREHDGEIEPDDPPARHRLGVFAQITVPDMAGGAGGAGRTFTAATACSPPQQQRAAADVEDDQKHDIPRPGVAHELFSLCSSSGRRAEIGRASCRERGCKYV